MGNWGIFTVCCGQPRVVTVDWITKRLTITDLNLNKLRLTSYYLPRSF